MLRHRVDKASAGVGVALPARLEHVAQQEQSRELKTILQVLVRPAVHPALALAPGRGQTEPAGRARLLRPAATPRRRTSAKHKSTRWSRRSRRRFPDRARSRVRPAWRARI